MSDPVVLEVFMLDVLNLGEFLIPSIVIFCGIIGFVLKKWIKDIDNKWIPTTVCFLGIVVSVLNSGTNFKAVLMGAVSGLASTGIHQLIKNFIEKGGKNDG